MKSKRSKACDISKETKIKVWERDKGCVFCGTTQAFPNMHYIPRSKGGLGIEENILTGCMDCHRKFDFGTAEERLDFKWQARQYLKSKYPDWNEENLYYRKW